MKINQKGFSLIEVIIAITILSFIAITVITTSEEAFNSYINIKNEDIGKIQAIRSFNKIKSDFMHIYNPFYFEYIVSNNQDDYNYKKFDKDESVDDSFFIGLSENKSLIPTVRYEKDNFIEFLSLTTRKKTIDSKLSRINWLKYQLIKQENSENYDLFRYEKNLNFYNPADEQKYNRKDLVFKNIIKIEYEFWDNKNKKFTTSLNDINQKNNPIKHFKIKLKWKDSDGFESNNTLITRSMWSDFDALNEKKEESEKENKEKSNKQNSENQSVVN